MRRLNKTLALLLAVLMLLGMVPTALAADSAGGYTDVAAGSWFYEDVVYVTENSLMDGLTADTFGPKEPVTRQALTAALNRLSGSSDTDTTPDSSVRREEVAVILYQSVGGTQQADASLAQFTDSGDISADARDAMAWAVANGLFQGSAGKLDPQGIATRAEVAAVLHRFASLPKEISLDLADYMDKWVYVSEMPKTERGDVVYNEDGTPVMESVQPCYALKGVPYCLKPADASIQVLDIYVPAEYLDAKDNGDGTYTCTTRKGGTFTREDGVSYTAGNAPIIYQNTIDGYAQGDLLQLTSGRKGNGVGTYNSYLESGYVLVSVGSRGITSKVDGTAPACIVDLKAGIRLLKANDDVIPGDTNKIIATGTSAGGAVTSVLGASGNAEEYLPYLEEIGARMDSTDDIYCALAFCPITNLGIGDAAYEWLHASETAVASGLGMGGFGGMGGGPGGAGGMGGPNAGGMGGPGGPGGGTGGGNAEPEEFSAFELALHKALYEAYLKDLEAMGLDPDAFYDSFLDQINACIAYYVEHYVEDLDAFADENDVLLRDGDSFSAESVEAFVSEYMGRSKGVPSFDSLEYKNKENDLFDGEHFSQELLTILEGLSGEYKEAAAVLDDFKAQVTDERLKEVDLMTPIYFLQNSKSAVTAPYWRFRIGTNDGDLGAVAAWTITQLLEMEQGCTVDYGLVWGIGHMSADYSYADVQTYVDSICK